MTAKALIIEAIRMLPDNSTVDDIRERFEFITALQEGLRQVERGENIPLDEVEKKLTTWASR